MKHSRVFAAFNRGVLPTITVINKATVSLGVDFTALVTVLQKYVDTCLTPVWGTPAYLTIAKDFVPGTWALVFLDNADVAGALGLHDLTPDGFPLSKVFVKTTLGYGEKVSVTASHELCLSGDTMIPLLDGTESAIKDLVGRQSFWVYSCDNGFIRAGRGHSARRTRKNAPVVKITLDDGQSVRCTADHKFLMRDGTYKFAAQLYSGDSLMPLYRRIKLRSARKGSPLYDYEQVHVPAENRWRFTHQLICPCPSNFDVHHRNENRRNNSPDNLEPLPSGEHFKRHDKKRRTRNAQWNQESVEDGTHPFMQPQSEEKRRKSSEDITRYNKSVKHAEDMARYWARPGAREKAGECLRKYASSPENIARVTAMMRSPERRKQSSENITAYNKSEKHRALAAELGRKLFAAWHNNPQLKEKMSDVSRFGAHEFWHVNRGISKAGCKFCEGSPKPVLNHKVLSVEPCGNEDVYDLTVDTYHNFATSAGVFVHNCEMLVDPATNLCAQAPNGTLFALEVADAVEAQWFYVNSIPMSDFVFPSWYEGFRAPNSTQFDYMKKVTAPFQLLAGGYAIVFRRGKWTNLFGSAAKERAFAKEDRRGHRSEYRKAPKL